MAIIKKTQKRMTIDLTGPQGNAYFLLGCVKTLGKQLGFDDSRIKKIVEEMKSGDYENLITVFDNTFGDYLDLER